MTDLKGLAQEEVRDSNELARERAALEAFHKWCEARLAESAQFGRFLVEATLTGVLMFVTGPAGAKLSPAIAKGMAAITEKALSKLE